MQILTMGAFLSTGLAWGMLHAFDPDHVAAVAGVSASDQQQKQTRLWHFALRWSLGHGFAIAAIAAAVFLLGMAIPVTFSNYAEHSISFLLIALGGFALYNLRFKQDQAQRVALSSQRSAMFVGLIHGIAGSAPLLALIPLAQVAHPFIALLYVVFFSVGVLLAMSTLGGLMVYSLRSCSKVSIHYQLCVRYLLASVSIMVGLYLLISS